MTPERKESVVKRSLLNDISSKIEEARSAVAVTVNARLTILYRQTGKPINEEVLEGERAEYGEELVSTLSQQLVNSFGRSFADTYAEWFSSPRFFPMSKLSFH